MWDPWRSSRSTRSASTGSSAARFARASGAAYSKTRALAGCPLLGRTGLTGVGGNDMNDPERTWKAPAAEASFQNDSGLAQGPGPWSNAGSGRGDCEGKAGHEAARVHHAH